MTRAALALALLVALALPAHAGRDRTTRRCPGDGAQPVEVVAPGGRLFLCAREDSLAVELETGTVRKALLGPFRAGEVVVRELEACAPALPRPTRLRAAAVLEDGSTEWGPWGLTFTAWLPVCEE